MEGTGQCSSPLLVCPSCALVSGEGAAICSACGNTSAFHVVSVNAALLRWFCHEQPQRTCGGARNCTVPQGRWEPSRNGARQDPGCIRGVNLSMVQSWSSPAVQVILGVTWRCPQSPLSIAVPEKQSGLYCHWVEIVLLLKYV